MFASSANIFFPGDNKRALGSLVLYSTTQAFTCIFLGCEPQDSQKYVFGAQISFQLLFIGRVLDEFIHVELLH